MEQKGELLLPRFSFLNGWKLRLPTEPLPNPSNSRSTIVFFAVIPLDFNSTFDLAGLSLRLNYIDAELRDVRHYLHFFQEPFQEPMRDN